jgi:hypothetical protein
MFRHIDSPGELTYLPQVGVRAKTRLQAEADFQQGETCGRLDQAEEICPVDSHM